MKSKHMIALTGLLIALSITACTAAPTSPTSTPPPATQVVMGIPDRATLTSTSTAVQEKSGLRTTSTSTSNPPIPSSKTPAPTQTLIPTLQYTYTPTAIPPAPTVEGWRVPSEESGLAHGHNWFIFTDNETGQIGGFNQDGTGITWFDFPPLLNRYSFRNSGNHMAYIAEYDNQAGSVIRELIVVEYPAGTIVTRLLLHPDYFDLMNATSMMPYLVKENIGDLSWSPDSQYLAASGSSTGESTDIFLYSMVEDKWEQVTNEGAILFLPHWKTGDNQWLYYKEKRGHLELDIDVGLGENSKNWKIDVHTQEIVFLEQTIFYVPADWGDGFYDKWEETIGSSEEVKLLAITPSYVDIPGIYIQTLEDVEPRLIYETEYAGSARISWAEDMQRFIVDIHKETIIVTEWGEVEHQFTHYQENGKYIAGIDTEFRLKIYQIMPTGGLTLVWDMTELGRIYKTYITHGYDNFIVIGNGNIYYLDPSQRSFEILIANTASIYFDDRLWLPQN